MLVYDLNTISMFVPFGYEEYQSAKDTCNESEWPNEDNLLEALFKIAAVEHEKAHHRCTISTTMGYAVFFSQQCLDTRRRMILKQVGIDGISKARKEYNGNLTKYASESKELQEKYIAVDTILYNDIVRMLLFSDIRSLQRLTDLNLFRPIFVDILDSSGKRGTRSSPSLLVNFKLPTPSDLRMLEDAPSALYLHEAAAIWWEYCVISRFLWPESKRKMFSSGTRKWLSLSLGHERYRKAADIIYKFTGCNLSAVLPIVLIDMALMAPLFSQSPLEFSELHPSLRLMKIIGATSGMSDSIKKLDNIDLVHSGTYEEVRDNITKTLGWGTTHEAMKDTVQAMKYRHDQSEAMREMQPEDGFVLDVGDFYEYQFKKAYQIKSMSPMSILCPNSMDPYWPSVYQLSPIIMYFDRTAAINWELFKHSENIMKCYLSDCLLSTILKDQFEGTGMRTHGGLSHEELFKSIKDSYDKKFGNGDGFHEDCNSTFTRAVGFTIDAYLNQ